MAEIIGAPAGTPALSKSLQKNGMLWKVSRSFEREYLVLADSYGESQDAILSAVPQPLQYYLPRSPIEADGLPSGAFQKYYKMMVTPVLGPLAGAYMCKSVQIKEVDDVTHPETHQLTTLNRITCSFDNDLRLDPLELDPTVKVKSESVERVLEKDVQTGDPIQTACGEKLLQATEETITVLEISRYHNFPYNLNIIEEFKKTINQKEFWGRPARCALMDSIECDFVDVEIAEDMKKKYAHVTYRIKFRWDGDNPDNPNPWALKALHYGNLRFVKAGAPPEKNLDVNGKPCPCNLDARGFKLADNADPVFLTFNQYPEKDWDELEINNTQLGDSYQYQ